MSNPKEFYEVGNPKEWYQIGKSKAFFLKEHFPNKIVCSDYHNEISIYVPIKRFNLDDMYIRHAYTDDSKRRIFVDKNTFEYLNRLKKNGVIPKAPTFNEIINPNKPND